MKFADKTSEAVKSIQSTQNDKKNHVKCLFLNQRLILLVFSPTLRGDENVCVCDKSVDGMHYIAGGKIRGSHESQTMYV